MSKKRNACSSAGTLKQAGEQVERANLQKHDNTNEEKFPVFELLPKGKDEAVEPKYLVNVLGLRSTRELRKEIEWERKHGALILADLYGGGYFKPETLGEVAEFVGAMRHSIQTTEASIAPMEEALAAAGGEEI